METVSTETPYKESLAERAFAFSRTRVAPTVVARDREARWDGGLFRAAAELGLAGSVLPREHGGGGLDARELSASFGALGRGGGDAGLSAALWGHAAGCGVLLSRFGSDEQRRRYLPRMARGELVASLAFDEVHASGDQLGVQTRAERRRGGWVLRGHKRWAICAPTESLWLISAVTAPDLGLRGVSTFVLERGMPGLTVGPRLECAGLRTATFASLSFDGCEISEAHRLGPEGSCLTRAVPLLRRWQRATALAPWIGLFDALLEDCVAQTRARQLWGKPASHSQQHRAALADLKIRLELARRMQARAAELLDLDGADVDIATACLFVGTQLRAAAAGAHALLGSLALSPGNLCERLLRDVTALGLVLEEETLLRPVIAGATLGMG